jgi:dTDP-4-amino-4,6-dideoxygalactose transaminase
LINVTKTYLPEFDAYCAMLKRAWSKEKLKAYLDVEHLWFTSNGTVVLQMALKALGITGEVITTPFSYVATTNAILWEGCKPVFVDVHPQSLCIDASLIEAAITADTQAILATHVYGFPCDVEAIEIIAKKHRLKVIYDGAHAFGCTYKGKSLLDYGDISTCSFHATKIFHTVEGGCIICNDKTLAKELYLYRSFGHIGDDYFSVGINAKNSELHAAMGLCVLPEMKAIIENRRRSFEQYDGLLNFDKIKRPIAIRGDDYNYAYYPVIFSSEQVLLKAREALLKESISTRRYFYPSLNKLPFVSGNQSCPVAEDTSSRVLSLPMAFDMKAADLERIATILNDNV